ncbi:helix-turn-helix transcriptional regulator [Kordia jejudonensis]|uniref:helix-turn-helix transcriptional regulator n=1 Tax=Kordia jejudonensis TaxID=1348245 RepID=UPI0006298F20|nr:LuxR C-terminal-related transcriptional regulator [Kordia jejudonensis]
MFKKIIAYHNTIINKGVEHVSTEFDKRVLKLLNFISLCGAILILPTVCILKLIKADYTSFFVTVFAEVIVITVIYLNRIGKSQISCLLYLFIMTSMAYVAVYFEEKQVEVPYVVLCIGFFSIFLIKNQLWKIVGFIYAFFTFSILHYIQLNDREFAISGYVLTLVILLIFAFGLKFFDRMRNRDEQTIRKQNDTLKHQNEVIKTTSEQLMQLEKEKYAQELLLKQKDIEMILTNNQVQTQLNENLIKKLKLAQREGKLENNINQVILELRQQNEINAKMKLSEQDLDVVNASFFENLLKAHPNITRTDKEFCSYIKLGLSSKEIAVVRNTTVNTVNVAKTRLRKKMELDSNVNIAAYLSSF